MKNILKALNDIMKSVGYVQKNAKNDFHGYRYASEAALLEALRPAMIEHGLVLIPSISNASTVDQHGNTLVSVEYTLAHISGEVWPEKITAMGCGNDMAKSGKVGDKGVYKAITGANKYLLFKLFQIETGDDPEKEEAAPQKEAETQHSPKKADTTGANKPVASKKIPPINVEDGFTASAEDVDKYAKVFVEALVFASTEKEVREFWKQEAKNRAYLSIETNNAEYKMMADACAARIEKLKGK